MFSAVYLVCMTGMPCQFFVDNIVYPSREVCVQQAENRIVEQSNRVLTGEIPPFEVEYQCIGWDKA